jgi:hypothetical protein
MLPNFLFRDFFSIRKSKFDFNSNCYSATKKNFEQQQEQKTHTQKSTWLGNMPFERN